MYMIMFVSKDFEQAAAVLQVWVDAGVGGVTILESAGMQRALDSGGIRADVGIVYSLKSLMRSTEVHHRTLFSAIKNDETLERVVKATTDYVEDWARPDVGVLFVWPLTHAYGLDKKFSG